ncbi:MAG: hypothetical protein M5U12_34680 [Verrucomicrobia bacterium]|nr:hypothetical protein [Verrucomicrobiota bacterium]
MDFHSFPLRIKEVPDRPHEAVLELGFALTCGGLARVRSPTRRWRRVVWEGRPKAPLEDGALQTLRARRAV